MAIEYPVRVKFEADQREIDKIKNSAGIAGGATSQQHRETQDKLVGIGKGLAVIGTALAILGAGVDPSLKTITGVILEGLFKLNRAVSKITDPLVEAQQSLLNGIKDKLFPEDKGGVSAPQQQSGLQTLEEGKKDLTNFFKNFQNQQQSGLASFVSSTKTKISDLFANGKTIIEMGLKSLFGDQGGEEEKVKDGILQSREVAQETPSIMKSFINSLDSGKQSVDTRFLSITNSLKSRESGVDSALNVLIRSIRQKSEEINRISVQGGPTRFSSGFNFTRG